MNRTHAIGLIATFVGLVVATDALAKPAACTQSIPEKIVVEASGAPKDRFEVLGFESNSKASTSSVVAGSLSVSNPSQTPWLVWFAPCDQVPAKPGLDGAFLVPPRLNGGIPAQLKLGATSQMCVRSWAHTSQYLMALLDLFWVFSADQAPVVPFDFGPVGVGKAKNVVAGVLAESVVQLLDYNTLKAAMDAMNAECTPCAGCVAALKCPPAVAKFVWAALSNKAVVKGVQGALTLIGAAPAAMAFGKLAGQVASANSFQDKASCYWNQPWGQKYQCTDLYQKYVEILGKVSTFTTLATDYKTQPGKFSIALSAKKVPTKLQLSKPMVLVKWLEPTALATVAGPKLTARVVVSDPCDMVASVSLTRAAPDGAVSTTPMTSANANWQADLYTAGWQAGKHTITARWKQTDGDEGDSSDRSVVVPETSAPVATADASWASGAPAMSLQAGKATSVSLQLHNSGTKPWPLGTKLALVSKPAFVNGGALTLGALAPGKTVSATWDLVAGPLPGTETLFVKVEQPDGSIIGGPLAMHVAVTTKPTPPQVTSGTWVSVVASAASVTAGETVLVTARAKNSGTTTWYGGPSAISLGAVTATGKPAQSPLYHGAWTGPATVAPLLGAVPPGAIGEWIFSGKVPDGAAAGTMSASFAVMSGGAAVTPAWTLQVQVVGPAYGTAGVAKADLLSPDGGETFAPGSSVPIQVLVAGMKGSTKTYLAYSVDGGGSVPIATLDGLGVLTHAWTAPSVNSTQVRVHVGVEALGYPPAYADSAQPFSIKAACSKPVAPEMYAPGSLILKPSVTVACSQADGAISYEFQRSVSSSFLKPDAVSTGESSSTFYGLTSGLHLFRVKASNPCGDSQWSNVVAIPAKINAAPTTAHTPDPPHGAQGVTIGKTLSWQGGDSDGGTVKYQVWIGQSPSNMQLSLGWKDDATSHVPYPPLQPGKNYSWQVKTKDDGGLVSDGPLWSFTTANEMADLAAEIVAVEGKFAPNGTLDVTWKATNLGNYTSKGTLAAIYLSKAKGGKEAKLSPDWLPVPPLAPGKAHTATTTITLGALDAGPAWLELWIDSAKHYDDADLGNHHASQAVAYKDDVKPTISQFSAGWCYKDVPDCYFKSESEVTFVVFGKDDTGITQMAVEASGDGESGWVPVVSGCKSDSGGWQTVCKWTPPKSFVKAKIWFRAVAQDASGNSASSILGPIAVVDGSKPSLAVSKPAPGSSFELGDSVAVEWTLGTANAVKEVRVRFHSDGAQACNCNSELVAQFQGSDPGNVAVTLPMNANWASKAARFQVLAYDAFGNWAEAWSAPFAVVDATSAPPPWSAPVTVSAPGQEPGRPVCAAATDGTARLAYATVAEGWTAGPIALRTLNGGELGGVVTIGKAGAGIAGHIAIAAAPDGQTTVAWVEDGKSVVVVDGTPGGSWTAPAQLAATQSGAWPSVASDAVGRWVCWVELAGKSVSCRYGSAGGGYGAAQQVFTDATYPSVVRTKNGQFLLVATGASSEKLQIARLTAGAIAGVASDVAAGSYDFWRPAVADDGTEALVRPSTAKLGEPEGQLRFATLSGTKLGPLDAVLLPASGSGDLALLSDKLARWNVLARISQGPAVAYAYRSAKGWSTASPVHSATENGIGNDTLTACRGGDERIHVVYRSFVGGKSVLRYTHAVPVVDTTAPVVGFSAPGLAAKLPVGEPIGLEWSASDASGIAGVEIEWAKAVAGPWALIADKQAASGTHVWVPPAGSGTTLFFRVSAVDGVGLQGSSVLGPLQLADTAPPQVTILAPGKGEKVAGGTDLAVLFDAQDNVAIVWLGVAASVDGGATWKVVAEPAPGEAGAKIALPAVNVASYALKVLAADAAGLQAEAVVEGLSVEVANSPPVAPYAPTPADGAADVAVASANLAWLAGDADPADKPTYDVWLAQAGAPLAKVKSGLTQPAFSPAALLPGAKYQWKVTATDGKAIVDGPTWTFTTLVPPPEPLASLDVLATTASSVALAWTGPADFTVALERAPDGSEQFVEVASVSAKDGAWTDTSAKAHTTYFYRARRKVGAASSTWTPPAQATTANTAPGLPELLAPAQEAGGIAPQTVTLTWKSMDADGDVLSADVYLGPSLPPALLAAGVTDTSLAVDDLAFSGVYFWRVVVSDPAGGTAQSAISTFFTAAPPVPAAPSNLSVMVVDEITVELTWDDNSTVENGFRVEAKTAQGWKTMATTAWSQATVKPPQDAATMTLRVVAFNESGDSPPSAEATAVLPGPVPGADAGTADAGTADAGAADADAGPNADADLDATPADANATPADAGAQPDASQDAVAADAALTDCKLDADCDDADPCTQDVCQGGQCGHAAVFGCCKSDASCEPGEACLGHACKPLLCAACKIDADCGTSGARCVAFAQGAGCLPRCDAGQACPAGTACGTAAGDTALCIPAADSCVCPPTGPWVCMAAGNAKVLLDACGKAVTGTEVTCPAGCVAGACAQEVVDAGVGVHAADADAEVAPDAADAGMPASDGSARADDGCSAGGARPAGLWPLLLLLAPAIARALRRRKAPGTR